MSLFSVKLLKLGVVTGLVIGMVLTVVSGLVSYGRVVRGWEVMSELLAMAVGGVYTIAFTKQIIKEKQWMVLVTKYEAFLLVVIIIWMLWMLLVMAVNNWPEQVDIIQRRIELVGVGNVGKGLVGVLNLMWEEAGVAVKWSVLGLLVVIGYHWLNSNVKAQRSKPQRKAKR